MNRHIEQIITLPHAKPPNIDNITPPTLAIKARSESNPGTLIPLRYDLIKGIPLPAATGWN